MEEFAQLVGVLVWPVILLIALVLFREPLREMTRDVGGRTQKLSIGSFSIELAPLTPMQADWMTNSGDIRNLSSAAVSDSSTPALFEQIKKGTEADYVIVDLAEGKDWLTSRLYLFAVYLGRISHLRAFVFIETNGMGRRRFLGVADPETVERALVRHEPEFYTAFRDAENLQQTSHPLEKMSDFELGMLAAAYLQAVQSISEPVTVGEKKYLALEPPDGSPKFWERARWINGASLESLLGEHLSEDFVQDDPLMSKGDRVASILLQQASFVALTDRRGRFIELYDRIAMLDAQWRDSFETSKG